MRIFRTTPFSLFDTLWQHRALMLEMARRDVIGRYRGSVLGIFWSFVQPLLMLTIYTFVFTQVFKARWHGDASSSELNFALNLFAGLIVFNIFAECANRAPGAILAHANFVTRVVFPLEIIPCVHLLASLFHAAISLLVLLSAQLLLTGYLPGTLIFAPLVFLPLLLMVAGVSWFLSATGVYWRDIGQIIGLLVTGLLFVSPIFFPISALPTQWRFLAEFNPLSYPIELFRQLLLLGQPPAWDSWAAYTAFSAMLAWLGFATFQYLRRGFADVL